jgi:hypothetical protein
MPPPPHINITLVDNIDFILNAQCSGASNVILSIFAIPRFIFGSFLWTFIFVCPTWLRPLFFKMLYPLIYDYGGKGIFENFLSDLFCLIVNAYYLILIVVIILGLMILDMVWFSFIREMLLLIDMARMDAEISKLAHQTEIDQKITQSQMNGLAKQVSLLKQKTEE